MKRYRYYTKLPSLVNPNTGPPKGERPWLCEDYDKQWEGPEGVYLSLSDVREEVLPVLENIARMDLEPRDLADIDNLITELREGT